LYWHFYERNRGLLEKNPRIGMAYQMLNKMDSNDKDKMVAQAEYYLEQIERL
jgi:deoxyribodipyrimidine photolyase-related protein